MSHFFLYLLTASYLRPQQLFHFVKRALRSSTSVKETLPDIRARESFQLKSTLPSSIAFQETNEFRFLNRSKTFPDAHVDWHCHDMPKLWRYNLHYFDYVCAPTFPVDSISSLISDWIDQCPQGTPEAWEPYTTSLRIVNWSKVFAQRISPKQEWLESLYLQARWLEQNIEYHILANHYLKNGVALFFAGAFFEGVEPHRWMTKGLKILQEEVREQFLADGGHFERSPMYHSIAVEDYLDVLNVMITNPELVHHDTVVHMKASIESALTFLQDICLPDGNFPLFNDSAFSITPHPSVVFEYAQRIIGHKRSSPPSDMSVLQKSSSGYYVMRHGQDMMIVDCGHVGPNYQPGHTHCDTLSYELALAGNRVVVDTGVHDYEAGERRHYARSTQAHNTVAVDGKDQSEIWGTFRVARRASPLHASLVQPNHSLVRFEGSHDGYHRLKEKVTHHRIIEYERETGWHICDELRGNGVHTMRNYIHLHPDLRTEMTGTHIQVTHVSGKAVCSVDVCGAVDVTIEQGRYFPEFGIELKNNVIVLTCTGVLPLRTEYRILKLS